MSEDLLSSVVHRSFSLGAARDLRLQYEDVTTAELKARWAAFLASPGVTAHDDGTVTWVYEAEVDAEGYPVDPGPPMTFEANDE